MVGDGHRDVGKLRAIEAVDVPQARGDAERVADLGDGVDHRRFGGGGVRDAEALGAALHNDLEVAAVHLRPELADARKAMLDAGALGAMVSGSGPTVVGLAGSAQEAAEIAARVGDHFDRVEVVLSPAGGPELSCG
ncbi:MAG: hypothetical protein ACOCT8_03920 [Actinomycetota bacterium]